MEGLFLLFSLYIMSKPLSKYTDKECYELYLEMIENSNTKWNSARALARRKDYGSAISMHIISMEEMVKGFIMFIDSRGFELRTIDGMDKIISKNHVLRHFVGFAMFVISIFLRDLGNLFMVYKNNPQLLYSMKDRDSEAWNSLKWYTLRKCVLIRNEFRWFSKIEQYRQDGYHVDYRTSSKPTELKEIEFTKLYIRLKDVRNTTKEFIKIYSSDDKGSIQEIQKNFKEEKLYENLAKSLSKITKERQNPFDMFEKEFFSK